eukprot:1698760-Rhodomonas_salina.1
MITLDGEPESLKEMKAFTVVPRPRNTKIITSKIVFKLKCKNGVVSRYKARCCARGFTQTYGVDFTDTHAAMAHPTAIRTVLAWGVEN